MAKPSFPTGQHEIVEQGLLLDPDGSLSEPGWARSPLLVYNKESVRASRFRMKEWDYYMVHDGRYAVAFTMCDAGYIGLVSVSVMDLAADAPFEITATELVPLPSGRISLPTKPLFGISSFSNGRMQMYFESSPERRVLDVIMRGFSGPDDFMAHIELDEMPRDSMVIATPFPGRPTAFYYNMKTVGMRASGAFTVGDKVHRFDAADSLGILDWGRGVWTYDNRWFWGVAQGRQDGRLIGLNLGYGFGDTGAASENMLFVDGVCHKLDRVDFGIPTDRKGAMRLMDRWHMTSNDDRLELEFAPLLDRAAMINMGIVMTDQHQVFGRISGTVVADDGERIEIRDMMASVEVVHNRY